MVSKRQTDIAVLGALSVEPMSGYAVRQAITDVLGHFWSESFGQIYPTLAVLLSDGLVDRTHDGDERRSQFAITERGLNHLRARLAEPIQPARPRDGLLLRLFFGRHLGPEECRRLLKDARRQAEQQLGDLDEIRREIQSEEPSEDHPFFLLTVSAGEHSARAVVAWAEESLRALERFGSKS